MDEQVAIIIKNYSTNPLNNYKMDDFSIYHEEWNIICDDNIIVYLKIENNKILWYSYIWDLSVVWLASASVLSEEIIWKDIDEILWYDLKYMRDLWFNVTSKRKRASILPLMAVRNAIHKFKQDWINDDFEDLWEKC